MITMKSLVGFILLFMLFTNNNRAQQMDNVFNFPLKPGMTEWKELKTHNEMLEVLQLPPNVIKSISTNSLIQTCLDYPLFSDLWAYDNIKEGFEQLRKDFNGFNELLNRKGVFEELLSFYEKLDPNAINEKNSLLNKGRYTAEL